MAPIYIEGYYGGSHKQMIDLLQQEFGGQVYTLPATKWNWRMRISALHFSDIIPKDFDSNVLFASSVNLCELLALRPDLSKLYKLYYFHENQLVYPVRKQQDRDFQHGYSQILSCLVADKVIFNSHYNKDSFLNSIATFMNIVPDYRPRHLTEKIAAKCLVLYFPIQLVSQLKIHSVSEHDEASGSSNECVSTQCVGNCKSVDENTSDMESPRGLLQSPHVLHILWPHRWIQLYIMISREHDKGPEEFCSVLLMLVNNQLPFKVSILGSHTNDIPEKLFVILGDRLLHKGFVPRQEYEETLATADVVISTAKHEFYGVAMLEAVFNGCYPLCPNRLVYPELYPSECMYNTEQQLYKRLKYFCLHPQEARDTKISSIMRLERFSWASLNEVYRELFERSIK